MAAATDRITHSPARREQAEVAALQAELDRLGAAAKSDTERAETQAAASTAELAAMEGRLAASAKQLAAARAAADGATARARELEAAQAEVRVPADKLERSVCASVLVCWGSN